MAAGPDPSRLALVIGNSAYHDAPLDNPGNDARAMAGLLGQAGFTVDSRLDCTRGDMLAAIERFGSALRRSEIKQAVFYYAGHGVQLDWRNYLAPIDAKVDTAEQLRQHCIDLGLLLRELGAAKDKTFIIILDACRDNPFGATYRPEQKGLAQFDAPVGSLIAYATSPGKGAADGSGKNGLYTENLVRELSVRGARIEDALKRVRLNVRLLSRGEQIPWEATSLESDIFLFNDPQHKLSDAELEKQIEADLAAWAGIKTSRNIDDWVGYLRSFPNGRFAEIGQLRLTRLLEEKEKEKEREREREKEKEKQARVAASVLTPAAMPVARAPAIEIKAGAPIPQLLQPSPNPYSAGRYPLGRRFTVGDEATFRESDFLTGVTQRTYTIRVTRVDLDADRVEINGGKGIIDSMGNPIKWWAREFNAPVQQTPAEFQVGKKWTAAYTESRPGQAPINISIAFHILRREKVIVPAGTFDAFRIEGWGWSMTHGSQIEFRQWLVPGLNFTVKREVLVRAPFGRFGDTDRHELVSLRQQVFGT